jgi:hypothetical protein
VERNEKKAAIGCHALELMGASIDPRDPGQNVAGVQIDGTRDGGGGRTGRVSLDRSCCMGNLHRVLAHTAGDTATVAEKGRHRASVEGRRHEHQPEIGPDLILHPPRHGEREVEIEAAAPPPSARQ